MIPTGSSAGGKPSIDQESQLPRMIGQPSSLTRARHSGACGPKQMSPRQTMRSTSRRSRSARTASSANRFPWMSEMKPTRMSTRSRGGPSVLEGGTGRRRESSVVAGARLPDPAGEHILLRMSFMSDSPGAELKVGDTLGSYRLDELLGEGGMGLVFK